jgi:hypothetical protein
MRGHGVSKNLNSMPRFTAEASLYSSSSHYHVHGMYGEVEQRVYLADYLDQICLGDCIKDCGVECAGTVGDLKAKCVSGCRADNAECYTRCTLPGDPPGSGNPCAPGTPCAVGGCCPPGFPICSSVLGSIVCCPSGSAGSSAGGTVLCCPSGFAASTIDGVVGTAVCCPSLFPVARTVIFLGVRCFPA